MLALHMYLMRLVNISLLYALVVPVLQKLQGPGDPGARALACMLSGPMRDHDACACLSWDKGKGTYLKAPFWSSQSLEGGCTSSTSWGSPNPIV